MGDFSKESLKIPMRVIRSQKLKESQRYVGIEVSCLYLAVTNIAQSDQA
jgi:hypothetical protein